MTIVEVMIALGLLAFLASSVIGVTFQVRSMAEQTVYQNTALTLAQGYMEQIRHLDYTSLSSVAQSTTVPLPLDDTNGNPINPTAGPAVLFNGTWFSQTIYLDQNAAGQPIQPMTFKFQAVLTSLETATAGVASGVEVVINYQAPYNFGVSRTLQGALRSVRSSVPTY